MCSCLQGLNYLGGTLLQFMDEEAAFWCMALIVRDVLKGYYDVNMLATQVHASAHAGADARPPSQCAAHTHAVVTVSGAC